jgi:hypothetical protein
VSRGVRWGLLLRDAHACNTNAREACTPTPVQACLPSRTPRPRTAGARTSSTPSSSTAMSSTSASISGGAAGTTLLPLALDPAEPLWLPASFSPAILRGAGAPTADAAAAHTVAQVQVAVCDLWRLPRSCPRTFFQYTVTNCDR